MHPPYWHPPVEPSQSEEQVMKRIRKAKLFVFLRTHRHGLLNKAFQDELAGLYRQTKRGRPPVAPAMLALAVILQAYTGASDDEAIEATQMDRRWQLVLDCLDTEQAPFGKGTLVAFRNRLIEAQMDRRLIERTIEIAAKTQAFGPRSLRAALDSSPLWGQGESRIRTICLAIRSKKRCAWSPSNEAKRWLTLAMRQGQSSCVAQA